MSFDAVRRAAERDCARLSRLNANATAIAASRALSALAGEFAGVTPANAKSIAKSVGRTIEKSAEIPSADAASVSLVAVAEAAASLSGLFEPSELKSSVRAAFAAIDAIAAEAPSLSVDAFLTHARSIAEADQAKNAARQEAKKAKERADRVLGANFARRLAEVESSKSALMTVLDEMKNRKPKLSVAAWKEAANLWVRKDDRRGGPAARQAIETKIVAVGTASRDTAAVDRAVAAGY